MKKKNDVCVLSFKGVNFLGEIWGKLNSFLVNLEGGKDGVVLSFKGF